MFTGPDLSEGEILKKAPLFEMHYKNQQLKFVQELENLEKQKTSETSRNTIRKKLRKTRKNEEERFMNAMRCLYYGRRLYRGRNKLADKMREMGFEGVMPKIVPILPTDGRPIGERGIITLARFKKLSKIKQDRLVEAILERNLVKSVASGKLEKTDDPTELVWQGRESLEDRVMRWLRRQFYYQVNRRPKRAQAKRPFIPRGARMVLQIDLIGPMRGCSDVLHGIVVIDVFTKKVWTKPVKSTKSSVVAKAFFGPGGLIFKIFKNEEEVPRRAVKLSTDNGAEFTGAGEKDFGWYVSNGVQVGSKKLKFVQLFGIAGRSTNQGHVERVNQTLKGPMYAAMQAENRQCWKGMLKESTFNYNDTRHSSTGLKPNDADEKKNERTVRQSLFAAAQKAGENRAEDTLPKGSLVRRKINKKANEKYFIGNFSEEVYRVAHVVVPRSVHARHRYHLQEVTQPGWQVIRPSKQEQRIQGRLTEKRRSDGVILNSSGNPIEFHYDTLLQIPVDSEPKPSEDEVKQLVRWCRSCSNERSCISFEKFQEKENKKAAELQKDRENARSQMKSKPQKRPKSRAEIELQSTLKVDKEIQKIQTKESWVDKLNERSERSEMKENTKILLDDNLKKTLQAIDVQRARDAYEWQKGKQNKKTTNSMEFMNNKLLNLKASPFCKKNVYSRVDKIFEGKNLQSFFDKIVNNGKGLLVPFDKENRQPVFFGNVAKANKYYMRIANLTTGNIPGPVRQDATFGRTGTRFMKGELSDQLDTVYVKKIEDGVEGKCTKKNDTRVQLVRPMYSAIDDSRVDLVFDETFDVVLGNDWEYNPSMAVFFDPPEKYEEEDVDKGLGRVKQYDEAYVKLFDKDRRIKHPSFFFELHVVAVLRLVQLGLEHKLENVDKT